MRGCTGFDRLVEYGEAVRVPGNHVNHPEINLNAENNLALAA